ncbi:MAG: hypothetical protein WDO16_24825 [Bacteroidota bacterium]
MLSDRRKQTAKDDKKTLDSISTAWEAIDVKRKEASVAFIKENPQSAVSAWVITRSFIFQPDLALLESLYNALSPAVYTTSYAQAIKERLDTEKRFHRGNRRLILHRQILQE